MNNSPEKTNITQKIAEHKKGAAAIAVGLLAAGGAAAYLAHDTQEPHPNKYSELTSQYDSTTVPTSEAPSTTEAPTTTVKSKASASSPVPGVRVTTTTNPEAAAEAAEANKKADAIAADMVDPTIGKTFTVLAGGQDRLIIEPGLKERTTPTTHSNNVVQAQKVEVLAPEVVENDGYKWLGWDEMDTTGQIHTRYAAVTEANIAHIKVIAPDQSVDQAGPFNPVLTTRTATVTADTNDIANETKDGQNYYFMFGSADTLERN